MTLWIVSIKDPYLLLNYELMLEKLNDSEKAAVKRFVFPEDLIVHCYQFYYNVPL
jgi:hypothetical protein